MCIHTQDSFVERVFMVILRELDEWKKHSTSHIRSEPTVGVLSPQRKCCFSPKRPNTCGAHCVWVCWSLASLVVHTSLRLAGFTGELGNPSAGAGDAPSEPSLAPPPDTVSTSVVLLWEAPQCNGIHVMENEKEAVDGLDVTPAPRSSCFTQLFLYSTKWLCLSWAQLTFGYSLVLIQCHAT